MPIDTVEQALSARLTDDTALWDAATGGIHYAVVPQRTAKPTVTRGIAAVPVVVVFSLQSPGADGNTLESGRSISNPLFFVRAIGEGAHFEGVRAAAERIDALLQGWRRLEDGEPRFICERESEVQLPPDEREGGAIGYVMGGMYRFRVMPDRAS